MEEYRDILIGTIFFILLILSIIDFKIKAVPDYLLLILLVLDIIFLFQYNPTNFIYMLSFTGGIVLLNFFITFYIQNIKSKIYKDKTLKNQTALGEGDIPVIATIGTLLEPNLAFVAVFLSAVFAIIPSIFYIIVKKENQLPFIPFLSLGLFVVYILGNRVYEII